MCGIIAFKGFNGAQASGLVLAGLRKLDYRGYDSWGVASANGSRLNVDKRVGKIEDFKGSLSGAAKVAIGHTRWATHGGVTEKNAHPHLSNDGFIAVVHNGIVENYQTLKRGLHEKGFTFSSETDTEVIPNLIQEALAQTHDFPEAVRRALLQLRGRYAVVALHAKTGELVGARNGSPLVVGLAENGVFLASDVPAFLEQTNRVVFLDDAELVCIQSEPRFASVATGKQLEKKAEQLDWMPEQAEKGEFPHFMLKEIVEQPETLLRAVQNREQLGRVARQLKQADAIYLVGCGTAGKVCLAGTYFFSRIAALQTRFCVGSEFGHWGPFLGEKSVLVAVSQSGETADTLEAVKTAKAAGAKVVSILNVFGSSMMRQSDETLLVHAGPEKAVASTKAATAQLAVLYALAHASAGSLDKGLARLDETASSLDELVSPAYREKVKSLAQKIKSRENLYIIGRGENHAIALESAIKLQEVSYIHAEGFAGGELKHGPIALIEKGTPCLALFGSDQTAADTLSNAVEIKSRGGYIVGVAPENNEVFDEWLPVSPKAVSPIANLVPVQLLAYYLAVLRGNNPDKPRNLAKVVTVK